MDLVKAKTKVASSPHLKQKKRFAYIEMRFPSPPDLSQNAAQQKRQMGVESTCHIAACPCGPIQTLGF